MFKKFYRKSFIITGFMFVFLLACNASATPITTTAEVVTAITVTEQTPLNFGRFSVGAVGGVVTFDAGGTVSVSGDVVHLGSEVGGVARLDTSGFAGGTPVTVSVTGTTLVSGGNSMAVVGNCLGPAGVLGADNGSCTFSSNATTTDDVQIGGKLTVGGSQPVGVYSGTLEVVAAY
jgi:hypothetical protein